MGDTSDSEVVTDTSGSSGGDFEVDVRHLRSALEFAVMVAREGAKARPAVKFPEELRPFIKRTRLKRSDLSAIRRVLAADDAFRTLLSHGATPELVGDVGWLWLARPDGWQTAIADAVREVEANEESAEHAAQLKRAERRREAAERTAARSAADLVGRDQRIEELQSELRSAADEIAQLRLESRRLNEAAAQAQLAERHARDRERAAAAREQAAASELEAMRQQTTTDRSSVDEVEPVQPVRDEITERERQAIAALSRVASDLAAGLAALNGGGDSTEAGFDSGGQAATIDGDRRRPQRMPGGVMSDSLAGTRFLFESGASVIIDGYNVTKLAWPHLSLEGQRRRLIGVAEQVAGRHGTEISIIFDGADVVGVASSARSTVRVAYSAPDQIADDRIRAEVAEHGPQRAVVVVTNDRELADDVAAAGANVVSSDRFVELARVTR